jgi:membrane fusion protein, multidrug efflux system
VSSTFSRSPRTVLGLAAAAVAVAAWWGTHLVRNAGAAAKHGVRAAVAVDVAAARRMDVPVFLDGLGSVQAYYTANVTSQIAGELQQVYFVEGQTVRKGQLLALIDPRAAAAALAGAVATKAKDVAQLAGAEDTLSQYEQLAPANLISRQTLDSQHALVAQFKAQVDADQAVADNARIQLAYTRITSPIAGRTGIRAIDPGNVVPANGSQPIVVVTQLRPIAVVFTLPEADLPEVRAALVAGPVPVTAIARDGAGERLDEGRVSVIDNQIDPTSGTMRMKATFPNAHDTLWPGQFVTARLLLRIDRGALAIPASALQRGPDGLFVYVVDAGSTVSVRALELDDLANGVQGMVVVTAGLRPGDKVVTSNQLKLFPGARVQVLAGGPGAESSVAARAANRPS